MKRRRRYRELSYLEQWHKAHGQYCPDRPPRYRSKDRSPRGLWQNFVGGYARGFNPKSRSWKTRYAAFSASYRSAPV
jgi:hypothetical protein